jgi:hypothetical protein
VIQGRDASRETEMDKQRGEVQGEKSDGRDIGHIARG